MLGSGKQALSWSADASLRVWDLESGAEALVLGTAPSGGRIPADWWDALDQAVAGGVSIVNGLHDKLSERYSNLPEPDQWIWDIRSPQADCGARG